MHMANRGFVIKCVTYQVIDCGAAVSVDGDISGFIVLSMNFNISDVIN